MFTATEDFKDRPYKVGAQQDSPDFQTFIDGREEKILIGLLGYELYKQFKDAVEASELEVSDPDYIVLPERFQELRDGADYTLDGNLYKYGGIVPLLKPAIYSYWLQQQTYKNTGGGIVQNLPTMSQSGAALSENVDGEEFRVQAWNEFVMLVGASSGFSTCYHVNTFYGFMLSREDEWINDDDAAIWLFKAPSFQNRFGL
jgi:hypothetical protein